MTYPPGADLAGQLRTRRRAAWRLEPLPDGRRDPFDRLALPAGPSDYGLDRHELLAEIERCKKAGWTGWELKLRFADPAKVAA